MFGTVVLAQETELPNPGLTPDSPLYFLDTLGEKIGMFFTFGAERKAEKAMKYAEEKLAEVRAMAEENKPEAVEKANQKYQEFLDLANKKTKEAKEKGKDVERLVTLISEKTLNHQEVLLEVFEKIPEQARSGIKKAIEVSKKGFETAIEVVSGEKKEKLEQKAQKTKTKIEEKIKGKTPKIEGEPYVTVLFPNNGGERIVEGQTVTIHWTVASEYRETKFYFYILDVTTAGEWTPKEIGGYIGSAYGKDGTLSWTPNIELYVPAGGQKQYKIRISNKADEVCASGICPTPTPYVYDDSNAPFIIASAPSITIISPNGGEEWIEGETYKIRWQSSGVEKVNIEYGNGKSWFIERDFPAEIGEFSWTPEGIISQYEGFVYPQDLTEVNIKIGIWDAQNVDIFDKSDNDFTIIEPSVTVISPNGGDKWEYGQSYKIKYSSAGVTRVGFKVLKGSQVVYESESPTPAGTMINYLVNPSYSSSIGSGDDYKVRIYDWDNPYISDESDVPFYIVPSITIASPNGGEQWRIWETYRIEWTSKGVTDEEATITWFEFDSSGNPLSDSGGVIATVPASQGYYDWEVPLLFDTPKTRCKIMVLLPIGVPSVAGDVSDNYFSIID